MFRTPNDRPKSHVGYETEPQHRNSFHRCIRHGSARASHWVIKDEDLELSMRP